MPSIALRLRPQDLSNPDAEFRYALPGLIVPRSGGTVRSDSNDYTEDGSMMIFLGCDELAATVKLVAKVVATETVLGNVLDGVLEIAVV